MDRKRMRELLKGVTRTEQEACDAEESAFRFIENNYSASNNKPALYYAKIQQVYHLLSTNSYISYKPKKLDFKNLAFQTISELCPEKYELLRSDISVIQQGIHEFKDLYTSNKFTCPVCQKKKCIYSEVQVRSCDENATIFVRCMNCGNCFRG